MTCTYRRKRIPEVHADAARALDDEYYAIEQVADCLQAQADALQASLDALQAKVDALELVDAGLQAQIDDLQAQIDALTATIEGLPYLTEVKEDLSPDLGGPLRTWGFPIALTSDIDAQQGILEALAGGGIGLATTDTNGFWDTSDAGIGLVNGEVQITGTTTKVDNLQSDGPREVWATQDGILYTVSPPIPGWEVTDSDTGTYAVGLTWTALTGLVVNTYAEIAAGSRYDASARIRVSNTGTESGIIRFAFGLDGNPPAVTGESVDVAADFIGLIPISGWSLAGSTIPAGTPVMLWVMEAAGNPPQFSPEITGDVADQHVFIVSVPAGAGATGACNLGIANITASSVTVTSDTGSDAILPAATNTAAGIATAAQVAAIEAAVQPARAVNTTGGLQGGGDLSADRTLSPVYGSVANTVCQGDDARLRNPYRIYSGTVQVGVIDIAPGNGVAIAATDSAGIWQAGYGAIDVTPTGTQIAGTTVRVDSLATGAAKAVLVDADGDLYTGVVDTPTNLSVSLRTATNLSILSSTGNSALVPEATVSLAGLMTAAQVTALNSTVPNTRAINTTNGLQGGGNLSLDRTIAPIYGTTANTICMGNDARLSDSRTPLAHTHTEANITDLDRMRFKSYWNATITYAKNDVVIDGPYIAIAKATTTDKPAPTFTQASPAWILSDAGTGWQELTGRRFFGHRYGPLIGDTLAQGVRFKTLSASVLQYAYLMVNGAGRFDLANNLITPANTWLEIRFPPIVLRLNDVVDLVCYVDDTHKYAWGPNSWPSGGTVKSFDSWDQTYPPTTFALLQFGADVLVQSGTQSANWAILCKSAT